MLRMSRWLARAPRPRRGAAVDREALGALDRLLGEPAKGPVVVVLRGTDPDLASATAIRWACTHRRRFQRVLYADLSAFRTSRGVSINSVVRLFLRALRVRRRAVPTATADAIGLFRAITATVPVLVVVDKADEPAQVRSVIPAAVDGIVVATTRRALSALTIDRAHFIEISRHAPPPPA